MFLIYYIYCLDMSNYRHIFAHKNTDIFANDVPSVVRNNNIRELTIDMYTNNVITYNINIKLISG